MKWVSLHNATTLSAMLLMRLLFKAVFLYFYFMNMGILLVCRFVSVEVRRGLWILWDWSYRQVAMRVLAI